MGSETYRAAMQAIDTPLSSDHSSRSLPPYSTNEALVKRQRAKAHTSRVAFIVVRCALDDAFTQPRVAPVKTQSAVQVEKVNGRVPLVRRAGADGNDFERWRETGRSTHEEHHRGKGYMPGLSRFSKKPLHSKLQCVPMVLTRHLRTGNCMTV